MCVCLVSFYLESLCIIRRKRLQITPTFLGFVVDLSPLQLDNWQSFQGRQFSYCCYSSLSGVCILLAKGLLSQSHRKKEVFFFSFLPGLHKGLHRGFQATNTFLLLHRVGKLSALQSKNRLIPESWGLGGEVESRWFYPQSCLSPWRQGYAQQKTPSR